MTSSDKSPTSLVEISISCSNLRETDTLSDPMCIVYNQQFGVKKWVELSRTECIKNTSNPEFATKISVNLYFEEQQPLKFSIVNSDSSNTDDAEEEFLGEYECTLAQLVGNELSEPLENDSYDDNGTITIETEELGSSKEVLHIQFSGQDLRNAEESDTANTYLEFFKKNESGKCSSVYITETATDTCNPDYKEFSVPLRNFCNGDYDLMMTIICREIDTSEDHNEIGSCYTTVRSLLDGPSEDNIYPLINKKEKKKKGRKYNGGGQIILNQARISHEASFVDYIKGGTKLNVVIAIDFTASNGNPKLENSLHYNHPKFLNQYGSAIQAVGSIIEEYDTDKLIPVLGFGAKLPPDYKSTSHSFHVNGNPSDPDCQQINGVIEAYYDSLAKVKLSGPTNFAPIIKQVAQSAKSSEQGDKYYILLMITDGIITDMPLTKQAIVNASDLPLSIIIIGVGDADFDEMEELDGDEERLSSKGRFAARDIVQFVAYRDFSDGGDDDEDTARSKLAREVLSEVPEQFISYMKDNNIAPQTPRNM